MLMFNKESKFFLIKIKILKLNKNLFKLNVLKKSKKIFPSKNPETAKKKSI